MALSHIYAIKFKFVCLIKYILQLRDCATASKTEFIFHN